MMMTMMPRFTIRRLFRNNRAVAAVEMALVAPLVILLIFGAAELGNLFYNEHILMKGVRDGARFASRQPFSAYDMGTCALSEDAKARVRRLVRTAQLAASGEAARLPNWVEADEASTISVDVQCDSSGTYQGVYVANANVAANVTVQARVPYTPVIGSFAFATSGLVLSASSQAALAGI